MAPRLATVKVELVDLFGQGQSSDDPLVLDQVGPLLADLGGAQIADDYRRLVLQLHGC
jgi:hypothetical protein